VISRVSRSNAQRLGDAQDRDLISAAQFEIVRIPSVDAMVMVFPKGMPLRFATMTGAGEDKDDPSKLARILFVNDTRIVPSRDLRGCMALSGRSPDAMARRSV
jgi:hypothetical protein